MVQDWKGICFEQKLGESCGERKTIYILFVEMIFEAQLEIYSFQQTLEVSIIKNGIPR